MPDQPPAEQRPRRRRAMPRLAAVAALATAASASYTIQPGDTLSAIAARQGISVSELARANALDDPDRIIAGRTLTLPGGGGGGGGGATHTVARGETLWGIARRTGVRVAAIAEANGIANPNRIREGQRLTIPGRTSTAPAAAASRSGSRGATPAAASSRADVGALIERVAAQHGWNPAFVKALAWQESGWSNGVVSPSGAIGIMQVIPATGEFVSWRFAGRTLNLNDPADNVLAGVLFLEYLYDETGGDTELTLAAYFQGLASVRRDGVLPSSRRYIANILALRDRF